ncbi:MAG: DUF924 domain-containing protein [Devosia nanyangense]|uniref:DUF924 domain-containing protein n=1 Tax=Devosia nanyangense TaxID=1228055 RepID=A0A933L0A8_9HYPH|nr:DUF924 domain-containing protein [Devosia nanyangense]
MKTFRDVLTFWFNDHGRDDWFGGKPEFDAEIAAQFAKTHAMLAKGAGWHWRSTPEGRLAEIIVLDQFSRQLFRGRPEAFASDGMALVLAQEAVGGGHHNFLPVPQRMFVLLPLMHAESLAVQAESLRLHTAIGNPDLMAYAEGHADCIRRFGRFPRRNTALGRTSTPEELAYMADNPRAF